VQRHLKLIITISLFCLIVNLIKYTFPVFSQNEATNIISNNTWISKRDGLNITMKIMPEIPVIDEKTKISFEIRKLNDSKFIEEDLNAKVTITDHDGRLFKFNNQYMPISNGKISVDYIFPDDGEHRIILQLYRNESAFALSYFNIVIPHPKEPPAPNGNFLDSLFKNLF
jgi:hypothetical protein